MRINCPYCGERSNEEFTIFGEACNKRPDPENSRASDWLEYVYDRKNPKGRLLEYWHHVGGCRNWLVVDRDSVSHEIYGVTATRQSPDADTGSKDK